MSDNTAVFLCAFWHEWRVHWGVRVCDNLVKGVPACVVEDFYRVYDPSVGGSVEHWFEGRRVFVEGDGVGVCRHFCRSDVGSPTVKNGCYFTGGTCVHSDVAGFGACVGCFCFVR